MGGMEMIGSAVQERLREFQAWTVTSSVTGIYLGHFLAARRHK